VNAQVIHPAASPLRLALVRSREKVIKAIRDEIYFLPNYAIEDALKFFPEIKKEEMYCYLNRKDKPYHWI